MKPGLLGCLLFLLATRAWAHRLDEYLQAVRVSVETHRIGLSIELTPGVAVADQVLAVIDQDRDGRVSEAEVAAYVQRVLKDIRVGLDENVLALNLTDTSFPTLEGVKEGMGVIRIKATAPVKPLSVGKHTLSLTNAHLPAISVYLVNALTPKDRAIKVRKQTRDELQTTYRLEFSVGTFPVHGPSRREPSHGLRRTDRYDKRELYSRFGVKEYWIGGPANKSIEILALKEGRYDLHCAAEIQGKLTSVLLQGLEFDVKDIQ